MDNYSVPPSFVQEQPPIVQSSVQNSNQISDDNKPRLTKKIKIIITVVIITIISLTVGLVGAYMFNNSSQTQVTTEEIVSSTPSPANITSDADWKTFINVDQKYSINYPKNYFIDCLESGKCDIGFDHDPTSDDSSGTGNLISIIPLVLYYQYNSLGEYEDEEDEEYEELKELLDKLTKANAGEKIILDQEYSIERLSDIKLGASTAKVFKSSSDPYDGYFVKYYQLTNDDETFLVSGIYGNVPDDKVDSIIMSFKLLENDNSRILITDLNNDLGKNFSDIKIRYIYGDYAEGKAIYKNPTKEFPIKEDYRFYAAKNNGVWRIVWKEHYGSDSYDSCIKTLSNLEGLPVEFDCFFDDYPLDLINL